MKQPGAIDVRVFRFDPDGEQEGRFQSFTVATEEPLSVMAILAIVHDREPAVACRTSICFKGACGSCLVRVNGQDVFGCTTLAAPGDSITIEPHSRFAVLRDVVVDFSQPRSEGKGVSGSHD